MFNLDQSIAEWRRQMIAGGIKSPRVLDELESHLRADVEQQIRFGSTLPHAFASAVERIGQAAVLKGEFESVRKSREMHWRRTLKRTCAVGTVLFMAGAGLCYFVLIPPVMRANEQYISWLGIGSSHRPGAENAAFVGKLILGIGLGFALPAILSGFVKLGVLDYRKLVSLRRYVIVLNLILGALLTTPEVVTQLLMFIPLQLVYELGVWLAWHSERKETRRV